jgi:hypothetical protein
MFENINILMMILIIMKIAIMIPIMMNRIYTLALISRLAIPTTGIVLVGGDRIIHGIFRIIRIGGITVGMNLIGIYRLHLPIAGIRR